MQGVGPGIPIIQWFETVLAIERCDQRAVVHLFVKHGARTGVRRDRDRWHTDPEPVEAEAHHADDAGANWLQVPAGDFSVYLRIYAPEPAAFEGSWLPPAIERTSRIW